MKELLLLAMIVASALASAQSNHQTVNGPDCSGGWPTNMAFTHLKNAGLADNDSVNFSQTKTVRLASEKIGQDLWHQVYRVTFKLKSGGTVDTITIHDASDEECSMSGVEVFVVSKHLNAERK